MKVTIRYSELSKFFDKVILKPEYESNISFVVEGKLVEPLKIKNPVTEIPQKKDLRAKFLKMYANLPLGVRKDIIAVIDGETMSYQVCWLEIRHETKMAETILRYLDELKLI